MLAAAQGDAKQLLGLDHVPAEYEPLVSWLRWAAAENDEVVAPLGLLNDVTIWPIVGELLRDLIDVRLPDGPFASWLAVRRARHFIRIGDLHLAAASLQPALHADSSWRAEAWVVAAYLALRECNGDQAQRCLDDVLSLDPTRYETVEVNRIAIERARARNEWISPYVVLGLYRDESRSAAGRAWAARVRDARLLDPAVREERKADLNWALETIEAETDEPWFRLDTDPQLPAPEGHGLLRPASRPLPRTTSYGVADVHAAAAEWLDHLIARLLTVTSTEQGMALDA